MCHWRLFIEKVLFSFFQAKCEREFFIVEIHGSGKLYDNRVKKNNHDFLAFVINEILKVISRAFVKLMQIPDKKAYKKIFFIIYLNNRNSPNKWIADQPKTTINQLSKKWIFHITNDMSYELIIIQFSIFWG